MPLVDTNLNLPLNILSLILALNLSPLFRWFKITHFLLFLIPVGCSSQLPMFCSDKCTRISVVYILGLAHQIVHPSVYGLEL